MRALVLALALAACAPSEVRYGSPIGILNSNLWPIREAAYHAVVLIDVTRSDGSIHHESATVINMHQLLTAAGACWDGQRIQLADTHPLTVATVGAADLCVLQSATELGYPLALAWEYEFRAPLDQHLFVEDRTTPGLGGHVGVLWRGQDGHITERRAQVHSMRRYDDGDWGTLSGTYTADQLGAIVYTGAHMGGVVGIVLGEDAEHRPLVAWTRALHRFLDDAGSAYITGSDGGALDAMIRMRR